MAVEAHGSSSAVYSGRCTVHLIASLRLPVRGTSPPLQMRLCHLSLVQQLIKFKARCKHRCILALGLSLILILCANLRVPWGLSGKESVCNEGDPGSTSGSGRAPGEGNGHPLQYSWASLGAQTVKNPPAVWETRIRSLGGKDPL